MSAKYKTESIEIRHVIDGDKKTCPDKENSGIQERVHTASIPSHEEQKQEADESYINEATHLRKLLKLYFYAAFKWKNNTCSFHLIYCFVFLIQVIKVSLITDQIFKFSYDRGNFSSVVNRGHLTLRHLLLQGWTASWETLPYPPAHGDFAVYTIDDLESGINFAVSRYYNAEEEAIGYYVRMKEDEMTATIKYFTFPGFGDTQDEGINTFDITFPTDAGLTSTNVGNKTVYSYNVTKEFAHLNLSQPMKRMLSTTLQFSLHSVRLHRDSKLATCLQVKGEVIYTDLDNNGQVNVDLETHTTRIECKTMNLTLEDWELKSTLKEVGGAVMAFCVISLVITLLAISFGLYVYWKTKMFMKEHIKDFYGHRDEEKEDLPPSEYFRFLKFWDITVIVSDILTLVATDFITYKTEDRELMIETLDSQTVWLGIGCVFAWTSILRFFKFNIKFHLLFSTLYRAFWDVMAYLICVTVLFVGFWVCGYVVMGPYHVKFRTPEAAAETLFATVNGDEIYATLAILESKKSGGRWIFWNCMQIGKKRKMCDQWKKLCVVILQNMILRAITYSFLSRVF
ncbi:mucolipin-3-like isoform X2 [Mercenaria mercenaria]|uniref:mucolipin-3-like isoform X2 n=1 Tax=Mercenaria mercenaria TaxID=6596 RepID=UPI00234E441D|nr:mucolipin-3-like isoform X2 [Mercenaria mercenaria]